MKGDFFMREKIAKSIIVATTSMLLSLVSIVGQNLCIAPIAAAVMSSYTIRSISIVGMMITCIITMKFVTAAKYITIILSLVIIVGLFNGTKRMGNASAAFVSFLVTVVLCGTDILLGRGNISEYMIVGGLGVFSYVATILYKYIINYIMDCGKILSHKNTSVDNQLLYEYEDRLKMVSQSFMRLSRYVSEISEEIEEDIKVDTRGDIKADLEDNLEVNIENKTQKNVSDGISQHLLNDKQKESRSIISMYLSETGQIINDIARNSEKYTNQKESSERILDLQRNLRKSGILSADIKVYEDRGRKSISLYLRKKCRKYVTVVNVAKEIEKTFGRKYTCHSNKKFVDSKWEMYSFVQEGNFFVMHGVAKRSFNDTFSGDNYTCIDMDNGQTLLSISDGMGTGARAHIESAHVVNLIEEFVECGYSEELTLKLINSMFVTNGHMQPATVDMSIIDTYAGTIGMVKSGAAATYLKHADVVESIKSTSLPVGMFENADMECAKKKLYDGDFVIMMSDGLVESVRDENKEDIIGNIILNAKSKKPRELAGEIMSSVCSLCGNAITDDMTVLVTGIWDKFA